MIYQKYLGFNKSELGDFNLMQFLYQTIKEIIDTGRVGTPVFVRFIAHVLPSDEHIIDTLGRILTITGSWLNAMPIRIYVQHKENTAQITASVEYEDGQTAIASIGIAAGLSSRIDLMMLGNKGALYHDGEDMHPEFSMDIDLMVIPDWLIEAIERSLFIGKPVLIQEVLDIE
jgi:hypothetical protein